MEYNNLQPRQKKLALINDFCGYGRCSITAELPVISAMGVQCCPLPTAIFSNHTAFPSHFRTDFTPHFGDYAAQWQRLGLVFDGISIGYLGSHRQIALVQDFLTRFRNPGTRVLLDPVMGDHGRLYGAFSPQLAACMTELLPFAHILTPNLTEACILTGTPYQEEFTPEQLFQLCHTLSALGPEKIVISGLSQGDRLGNFVFQKGESPVTLWTKKLGESRCGTGDVFSAVLAADMVRGTDFVASVQKAMDFISLAITHTLRLDIPSTDGLAIESCLDFLWSRD